MLGSLLFAYGLQAALSDKPSTPAPAVPKHATPCVDGAAEGFPCLNVDLYAHISNAQLGGGNGNDIWGWTDPDTGREYALMGLTNGTAFVDISDPEFPARLGILPTHSGNSTWRDIKTRGYYAFIVSEATDHGEADAMYELAKIAHGAGDLASARNYYWRSAHLGSAAAMNDFGWLADKEGDRATALAWYERAADRGDTAAMYALGALALAEVDRPTALTWLRRATALGDPAARGALQSLGEPAT